MKKYFCFIFVLHMFSLMVSAQVSLVNLLTENSVNPVGLDISQPRFTWLLGSEKRNVSQTAYEIKITHGKSDVWQTGKVMSSQSVHVIYNGTPLQSGTKYMWQVRVWDNEGKVSSWSKPATFQMAYLKSTDWKAKWIQPGFAEDPELRPSPLMRKDFMVSKKMASATASITAHGMYEAQINGKRVGDAYLTPGWTAYNSRLQYQVYDVTSLLKPGANAIGIMLGNGWYRGIIGYANNINYYGKDISLLCQIDIAYNDGSKESIVTDPTWKSSTGAVRYSEIYNGETIDARMDKSGWTLAGYNDKDWSDVKETSFPLQKLVATVNEPVRKHEVFVPLKIFKTPKGEDVIDFGQNLVGWVQIKVTGKAGDKIVISHAEALDKEGNFYTVNLREARSQDIYILKGGTEEIFEPHFTWHGFRYIRVECYPGDLIAGNFNAVALYSDMKPTGIFMSSNALVNQLQHNIQWGQKGNFLDVPTDCPQRDERLGWTGDAQVFSRTATFNMNVNNFFSKWLRDVEADQVDGAVPFVIPNVLGVNATNSTGWADVATILPWNIYLAYGDKKVLEQQYASMKSYVESIRRIARNDLWNTGFHFGDWLFYRPEDDAEGRSAVTDKYLIAQCFYANSTQLLIKAAEVLGKTEDAAFYKVLLHKIKDAFLKEYMTPNGRLVSGTQTAYVLALQFDMLPETLRTQAARRLAENINSYSNHLTTGFLGTPYLCHVLTRFGYNKLAYKLLLQDTYPSWLYPVKMGATTIWERWDGIKPDSTFQTPSMNSLNHYSYGAIGDWMYRKMAGLDTYEDGVGYKHSMVKPHVGGGFSSVSASLDTYYGTFSSKWKTEPERILFDIVVPANTTSTVFIPAINADDVTEEGTVLAQVPGLKVGPVEEGYVLIEVGSGSWHFEAKRAIDEHADYADYVGKYKVEGGMSDLIEVSVQEGKIFISINSNRGELFPVQDEKDRFTDASSHVVTFQRDSDERVVSIKVEVEGTEIVGKKE